MDYKISLSRKRILIFLFLIFILLLSGLAAFISPYFLFPTMMLLAIPSAALGIVSGNLRDFLFDYVDAVGGNFIPVSLMSWLYILFFWLVVVALLSIRIKKISA